MAEESVLPPRARELLFITLFTVLAVRIHPALVLVVLWYVILKRLEENGYLDRWDATRVFGIVLMVRTGRGQRALEILSSPRRFWRIFGEVSLWTCRVVSVLVLLVFVLTFIVTILNPSEMPQPTASQLILIPGITPAVPLGWGLAGLVFSLVIHEYGHGVLARAHGMRVRSFGLLLIGVIPIGAFAEPETSELMRAPSKERQRVFAAGPAVNIFASFICFLIMAALANQFVAVVPGVHAEGIIEDQPAAEAGLAPWEIITHVNGTTLADYSAMTVVLDSHQAGDVIELTVLSNPNETGQRDERNLTVTLADKHAHYLELGVSADNLELSGVQPGDAFLGVSGLSSNDAGTQSLAGPFRHDAPDGVLVTTLGMAFHPLTIMQTPIAYKGEIMHPLEMELVAAPDSLLGTKGSLFALHLLFWLTWWNVLLGFANLIPLVPFDGGHLLRDRIHDHLSRISRITGKWHPIEVKEMAYKASRISSLTVLMMFIALIFLPMLF